MNPARNEVTEFAARRQREQRRYHARRPRKIGDVLAQLMSVRGYGRLQADAELQQAWQAAAGETLGRASRPGRLRHGKLEVTVTNSTMLQELTFQKRQILTELARRLPNAPVRDLRLRIGSIE